MIWSDWRVNRMPTQDDMFFYTKADTFTADEPEYTDEYDDHIIFIKEMMIGSEQIGIIPGNHTNWKLQQGE
jgi:hypothetical protein